MITILAPVDGSKGAERAIRHIVALNKGGLTLRVVLLNVQPEWAPPRSRNEERAGKLQHLEDSENATRGAKALLERAGIACSVAMRVARAPADGILEHVRRKRCDQIIMGTRGRGALTGLVLGSAAMKVVQLAPLPVTLVK